MKSAPWLLCLLIPLGVAWTARPAAPGPFAVVDLGRLIRENPSFLRERDVVGAWQQEMQQSLTTSEEELNALNMDLEQFQEGSAEHQKAREEVQVMAFRLKMREEKLTQELRERVLGALQRSHERVVEVVEKYRAEQGLLMVLQHNPSPLTSRSEEELVGEIVMRQVVVHDPQLDITGAVLTILD